MAEAAGGPWYPVTTNVQTTYLVAINFDDHVITFMPCQTDLSTCLCTPVDTLLVTTSRAKCTKMKDGIDFQYVQFCLRGSLATLAAHPWLYPTRAYATVLFECPSKFPQLNFCSYINIPVSSCKVKYAEFLSLQMNFHCPGARSCAFRHARALLKLEGLKLAGTDPEQNAMIVMTCRSLVTFHHLIFGYLCLGGWNTSTCV